jgi:hypothetical protein
LDRAKSEVLSRLSSVDAQRGYRHVIDEFVEWHRSEPRLSFNRTVVLRHRIHLESRGLAPGTINLRLGAVRRLAYAAADCGLLSPDLAAGIRRLKGLKKLGGPPGELADPRAISPSGQLSTGRITVSPVIRCQFLTRSNVANSNKIEIFIAFDIRAA